MLFFIYCSLAIGSVQVGQLLGGGIATGINNLRGVKSPDWIGKDWSGTVKNVQALTPSAIFEMSKAAIGAMADDFKRGDIYDMTTDVLTVGTMLTATNGLKNTAKNVTTKLRAPKVGSVVDDVAKGAGGANKKIISEVETPIANGKRVGSGTKVDDVKPVWGNDPNGKPTIKKEFPHVPKEHGFPDIVDNYPTVANEFPLVGGDGINRRFFQIEGSHNGKTGVFEWIVEPNGNVSHRRFIDGGVLTGKPNQVPKK